jgi:hypothetical protein
MLSDLQTLIVVMKLLHFVLQKSMYIHLKTKILCSRILNFFLKKKNELHLVLIKSKNFLYIFVTLLVDIFHKMCLLFLVIYNTVNTNLHHIDDIFRSIN